jgi:hypothetical protein
VDGWLGPRRVQPWKLSLRCEDVGSRTAVSCVTAPLFAEDAALVRARALLDGVGLVDGHNDLPWTLRETFEFGREVVREMNRLDLESGRVRESQFRGKLGSGLRSDGTHGRSVAAERTEGACPCLCAWPRSSRLRRCGVVEPWLSPPVR